LFAQVRVELGFAAGSQAYETPDLNSRFLIGPELALTRRHVTLSYALDHADLSSAGSLYASHFDLGYGWTLAHNVTLRAGAGPTYVTIEQLGGEWTGNAQLELALRTGRLEWFAKARAYDYSLSEFRIASASPDGPAFMGGIRYTLRD
jgi:hypothetical protein